MAISILIVDNDQITRDILARLLEFEIPSAILHVTPLFENALELCSAYKVDIVITATSMPPDSSDSMLRCIRAMPYNPVKIIIMTTSGDHGDNEPMYAAPNTYLIPKPIEMDRLLNLVQDIIARIETERVTERVKNLQESRKYRILLVESEDNSRLLLERYLSESFPDVELHSTSTPGATLQLLKNNAYDIVICDAFIRLDDRIAFIGEMCTEADIILVIISGETHVTTESFSPHINKDCIHHLLYKPVDLDELRNTVQCAILRLKGHRQESSTPD